MNVDAYLQRIKYTGSRDTTLATLKGLVKAQATSVPYCNAGFFGGPKCLLNFSYMYNSIVTRKQGDICYVCNGLFAWLLRKLGFNVKNSEAKYYINDDYTPPFYHIVPLVNIDGEEWLVDLGCWTNLLEPIKVYSPQQQIQPLGIFRCRKAEDEEQCFFLERFRKSVLNAKNEVIHQGPRAISENDILNQVEEKSYDTKLWRLIYKFYIRNHPINAFSDMANRIQDDKNHRLQQSVVAHMYLDEQRLFILYAGELVIKELVDPLTVKIIYETKVKSDQEVTELLKKYANVELDFKLNFFSKIS